MKNLSQNQRWSRSTESRIFNYSSVVRPEQLPFIDVLGEKKENTDVDLEVYPNSPRKYNKGILLLVNAPEKAHITEDTSSSVNDICTKEFSMNPIPDVITSKVFVDVEVDQENSLLPNSTRLPTKDIPTKVPFATEESADNDVFVVPAPTLEPASIKSNSEVLPTIMEDEDCEDKNVLDRITHDLDYLLNRKPEGEIISYQRHKKQTGTDPNKPIPSTNL